MARPRQPTRLLELKGAFQAHPSRRKERQGEPSPTTAVGTPPKHLSAHARRCWAEFASEGAQWLTGADRSLLQVASVLMSEFETSPTEMVGVKVAQLRGVLNDLGFSPTSRTRISAPPSARSEPNPFEQFQ